VNALITITSRKPQFERRMLIAAVSFWSMIVAGWAIVFLYFQRHVSHTDHNPGLTDFFPIGLLGSVLLFAVGLLMLLVGCIDFVIRSWQYRRDLRSLAGSVPLTKPRP
jgi:flagellar biosynthesis protein FlhB